MSVRAQFTEVIAQDLSAVCARYTSLGIPLEDFLSYVWAIVCKHLGSSPPEAAALAFAHRLYLCDLYLTCGCALKIEGAWRILDSEYRHFVTGVVRFSHKDGTDFEEVADAVLVSLYLPDGSGRHRIASYEGRSSLATWMRVIVINRAINEKHNKYFCHCEEIPDVPDRSALASIELNLRAERYRIPLKDALHQAFQKLSPRERLMLLWRYDENLQLGEIGLLLGIHQSNVTRQLRHLEARVKERVSAILSESHHLSQPAIAECFDDVVDNPYHSLSVVNLIKDSSESKASVRLQSGSPR